jgi:photosystem II stability/assembly factor-like uncharacterized protein
VYFFNPREGWVLSMVGTAGLADIFRTTDSGGHWSLVTRLAIPAQFNLQGRLMMLSSSRGWFLPRYDPANPPFVYATRDGGATWQVQIVKAPNGTHFLANSEIEKLQFFNDLEGALVVSSGLCASSTCSGASVRWYAYTTSDGGTHWSDPTQVPVSGAPIDVRIVFTDVKNGVAEDPAGRLLRTSDAGQHWAVLAPGLPGWAYWFDFVDASHGWASSSAGERLYRTTDGGANWTQVSFPN